MTSTENGELIVCVSDDPIDDEAIASVKSGLPDAIVLADLLEPLYDTSIPTREAAQKLGRVKPELEFMAGGGARTVGLCQRRPADLGTRAHFMASLCASADRVIDRCALS